MMNHHVIEHQTRETDARVAIREYKIVKQRSHDFEERVSAHSWKHSQKPHATIQLSLVSHTEILTAQRTHRVASADRRPGVKLRPRRGAVHAM